MAPFFLLLFVTLLLFFIQGAFGFINFFFHTVLQNISLFLWGRDSLKMISNIIIYIIIFQTIVKYSNTLRFVRGIINISKKRSNNDAPYKTESIAILNYCLENYDVNYYITDHLERISPPKEETNVLQDCMKKEIDETESSLDEKEEESDEQKEEEWSHPCLPSNESNSVNLTLYECYDPM